MRNEVLVEGAALANQAATLSGSLADPSGLLHAWGLNGTEDILSRYLRIYTESQHKSDR